MCSSSRAMFIPPHSVSSQQLENRNRRPACFRRAKNDSLSFLPNDTSFHVPSRSSLSSTFVIGDAVVATDANVSDAVLSTSDIVSGTVLAFLLAFGWSYLNGQRSSSDFISWRSQLTSMPDATEAATSGESDTTKRVEGGERIGYDADDTFNGDASDKVFNAENWKEMSREENYVLYNTRIREVGRERRAGREDTASKGGAEGYASIASGIRSEKKGVLVALLVLFVPIFSMEFFFALSRQFMCGDPVNQTEWAQIMCSPYRGPS